MLYFVHQQHLIIAIRRIRPPERDFNFPLLHLLNRNRLMSSWKQPISAPRFLLVLIAVMVHRRPKSIPVAVLRQNLMFHLQMLLTLWIVPAVTFAKMVLISNMIVPMRMVHLRSATLPTQRCSFRDPKSNLAFQWLTFFHINYGWTMTSMCSALLAPGTWQ